jgi:hypothetical protein
MTSSDVRIPLAAIKGRGSSSRIAHRFVHDARNAFDDGWDTLAAGTDGTPPPPATAVTWEDPRSVISSNESPDVYFERSLNPYRGCEHGCIYCYARPNHSYINLSPGIDFETKLIAKRNVAGVLRAELARKGYQPKLIAIGTSTDCYQPVEASCGSRARCWRCCRRRGTRSAW